MAKFYCTQRFYQERTYYEETVYSTEPTKGTDEQPISEEEIHSFIVSGQIKRLQPIDDDAKAMLAKAGVKRPGKAAAATATGPEKPVEAMTKAELVALAREKGITDADGMTKVQLVEAIQAADQG